MLQLAPSFGQSQPFSVCAALAGHTELVLEHRSRFKGRMINYAYTDAKRIRKHLLSVCNYHASKEDGLEFLVAVKCFGYQGGVVSVWVYYGLLDKPEHEE